MGLGEGLAREPAPQRGPAQGRVKVRAERHPDQQRHLHGLHEAEGGARGPMSGLSHGPWPVSSTAHR